jgi:hypothetical protein
MGREDNFNEGEEANKGKEREGDTQRHSSSSGGAPLDPYGEEDQENWH